MKFFCDRCNAKYSISDEKVRGKVVKIRCKRCGDVIEVSERKNQAHRSTPDAEASTGAPGNREGSGGEWYYSVEGQTFGPLDEDRLIEKYRSGELSANSYVWREDYSDWKPATDVEPFAAILDRQAEEAAGNARPRRNTMSAGDSIESVEASAGGSKSLSSGLGAAEGGDVAGRAGSTGDDGTESAGGVSSSWDRGEAGGGATEREGGSESSEGLGGERSTPEERGRSARRRNRERDSDGGGRSSAEDRRERLERLRGKLKSNFGSQGDSGGSDRGGEGAVPSPSESSAPPLSGESGEDPGSAASESSSGEVSDRAVPSGEAESATEWEVASSAGSSEPAGSGDGGEMVAAGEKTVDMDRGQLGAIREAVDDETGDVEDQEGAFDELEEVGAGELGSLDASGGGSSTGEERDEGEMSLPPAGSSRLDEEPAAAGESGLEPGEEVVDESRGEAADVALPSAPKLGDETSEGARSDSDSVSQSLLMQLDEIEGEDSLVRYVGAAAALLFVALGALITYIVFFAADGKGPEVSNDETSPQQAAMAEEDDGPLQQTYSKEEREKITALAPRKIGKPEARDDSKGSDPEGPGRGSSDESSGDRGNAAEEAESKEGPLGQGVDPTDEEGPTMDGAKRRTGDDGEGDLRDFDESGAVAKAAEAEESDSESGPNSREFEAMRAVEGSGPGVENPTEAAEARGAAGGGRALSNDQIREGMKGVRESVATCRRRHARRGAPIEAGKIYLTLDIEPTGKVSGYEISPEKLEGVVFERCLSSHKGRWHFGSFDGPAETLKAPFILQ